MAMNKSILNLDKGSSRLMALSALLLITLGVLGTWWMYRRVDHEMREELLTQTLLVGQAVNVHQVKSFTGTEADLNSANYLELNEHLSIILKTKDQCRYIYLLGRNDAGSVFFYLDTDEVDKAKPGEIYNEASKELKTMFDTGLPFVEGPLPDAWGVWISALVPVKDDETGKLIAVLGMDIDAQTWKWHVASQAAWPSGLMLAILTFLTSGVFMVRSRANEAIRISEARLKRAEFASKSGNWELNLKSQVINASEGAAAIYGITKGQLEYSIAKEIPLPEYRPFLDNSLKRLIEEDRLYDIEFKIKTADTGEIKDIHSVAFYDKEKGVLFGIIQDITDRKRMEEALSESEQRYRLHFENSLDAFLLTSPEGSVQSVNPATCEMFGRTAQEICQVGRNGIMDLSDPRLSVALEERSRTGKFAGELTGVRKDGTKFPIELSSTIFTDHNGNLRASIIMQDITERKRIQDALRESKEKWRKLVQTIPDYVALYDRDGKYLFLNHFAEGFSIKDIEGKSYTDLLADDSKACYQQAFEEAKRTGNTQYVEHDALGDNWAIKNYESYFVPIFENNQFENMMVIARDITERKRTQEELLKSKQLYDNLVSKIQVGVYILRSKPDGVFGLEYASPRMAEMLGLSVENLLANDEAIFEAIHPDDLGGFIKLNRDGIEYGRPFDWKGRVIVKGVVKWLHVSSMPQLLENGDTFWHGLIVDITERMRDEAEIKRKNEELTNLNATKDKFFSIIAHDLKSPFNSIIGFSSLLSRQLQEKDFSAIERYATIIQNSSQQAMDLLMNLLEWSRSQTGRIVFTPENIDLSVMINQSIELFYGSAQQKSITIYSKIAVTRSLLADKAMINTILRNLISNAIKFTKIGGEIIVSAEQKPHEIVVTVSDNGVGMDKESIGKLFRIDQSHSTLGTEKEKGTGLGLLLCSEFIEKHGGRIWVDSTPGKGSKFSFTIPETKIPNTSL